MPPLSSLRPWAAPIAAISIVGIALSMNHPLFALLLERQQASGLTIGLNATAASLAMVPAAILMPVILARIGLVPLMVLATAGIAIGMLAVPLWSDPVWWAAIRFLLGACATALFFASEFWIVANAPADRRGRVIGVYALVLSGAFLSGPVILKQISLDGWTPFLVGAAIVAAAFPAILWGRRTAPVTAGETKPGLADTLRFFVSDPGILWGAVLFGALEFGAMSLTTVWALRSGLSEQDALSVMVAIAAGAMVLQVPIGWIADRVDRRRLLLAAGASSVVAPVAMIAWAPGFVAVVAAAFVWGGFSVALYTVALAELGARYTGARLAAGNAAVVLAYGLGALVSPSLFGIALDLVPPDGLMWLAAALALAYAVLVALRIARAPRKALDSGSGASR